MLSARLLSAVCALTMTLVAPARAEDDAMHAAQLQAAEVVVTARMAGIMCPGIEVDEEAIRALMEHTQITDQDIMSEDRFGPEDRAMALSFKQSMKTDPDFCGKLFVFIGEKVKLLRRKPGAAG